MRLVLLLSAGNLCLLWGVPSCCRRTERGRRLIDLLCGDVASSAGSNPYPQITRDQVQAIPLHSWQTTEELTFLVAADYIRVNYWPT